MSKKLTIVITVFFTIIFSHLAGQQNVNAALTQESNGKQQIIVCEANKMVAAKEPQSNLVQGMRGNISPYSFWNLNNSSYYFSISNMHSYVYTNYYFNPNSQGIIYMSFISFNSGGHNITIRCFEVGSNSEVYSWTFNPENYSAITWSGLNPNKLYYFKFEINSGTLSGNGYIYH